MVIDHGNWTAVATAAIELRSIPAILYSDNNNNNNNNNVCDKDKIKNKLMDPVDTAMMKCSDSYKDGFICLNTHMFVCLCAGCSLKLLLFNRHANIVPRHLPNIYLLYSQFTCI